MINENILINRRGWIIEKIDEYFEGKITRKELQEWAFQHREWEPKTIKLYIDNNPSDVSNILDLLCYVLGERIEIGITDEELIDQKEYLEKIEEIFRRDILPRIGKLEGYYVGRKNGHLNFLISYSKDNEKFLENIIYKDSKVVQEKKMKIENIKKEIKDFPSLFDKKYRLYTEKRIGKEKYKDFLLDLLKNENLKEYYSVILREYHIITRALVTPI